MCLLAANMRISCGMIQSTVSATSGNTTWERCSISLPKGRAKYRLSALYWSISRVVWLFCEAGKYWPTEAPEETDEPMVACLLAWLLFCCVSLVLCFVVFCFVLFFF